MMRSASAAVSLTELADSPAWAGRYVRTLDLDPGAATAVSFDLFAESPSSLTHEDAHVAALRDTVQQTYRVFGTPYYKHYHFLIALSEEFSRVGLEHLSSTEIREPPHFFSKWKDLAASRTVISHEFVHSWNGKKHRPPTWPRPTSTCRWATRFCGATRARPITGPTCSRAAAGC